MANVILSELTGQAQALFGEVQGPIKSLIERLDEDWMHDEKNIAKKIFKQVPSTHRIEGYTGMTAFDDWEPVGENGEKPGSSTEQGYMKYLANEVWKSEFAISRELMDDKMDNILVGKPQGFMDAFHRAQQRFFAGLLGAALQGKLSHQIKGFSFDISCNDGACLFSEAHKPKVRGGDQCNAFTDEFSATALSRVVTRMQNFYDDKGNMLSVEPDTIIIPNVQEIKDEVLGVIGATHDPDVPAGNRINARYGNYTVITWKELNQYCKGDNIPWIVMDSHYNTVNDCAIWQDRVALEISSYVAKNNGANIWDGYARFGGGFVDFRAFAAGGLEFGATA